MHVRVRSRASDDDRDARTETTRAFARERHTHIVMQAPTVVVNQNASRETGSIARANNIAAAKAVSDVVRTTLGPRSMLKMILDASGGACDASFERSGRWGRGRDEEEREDGRERRMVKGSAARRSETRNRRGGPRLTI